MINVNSDGYDSQGNYLPYYGEQLGNSKYEQYKKERRQVKNVTWENLSSSGRNVRYPPLCENCSKPIIYHHNNDGVDMAIFRGNYSQPTVYIKLVPEDRKL